MYEFAGYLAVDWTRLFSDRTQSGNVTNCIKSILNYFPFINPTS